jgi:hypothetical protein
MNNLAFRRALLSLSHPASILGISVVLLNDHWWRRVAPSWFTGKIGDFAWLIFAPFLLAAILAWLFPRREKIVGYASIIGVGLIFGLAKTAPAFHALTIDVLEFLTGWPNILRLDPTDLMALPALLIAWLIWQQSAARSIRWPDRGWVLLPLAVLATMADSPQPNYGIACFEQKDDQIVAYDTYDSYFSQDGGLTWTDEDPKSHGQFCDAPPQEVVAPGNSRLRFRFTAEGLIERSDDGGQTWQREYAVAPMSEAQSAYAEQGKIAAVVKKGPLNGIIDAATGNLILALGYEGVLVRTPAGEWRRVEVGPYHAIDLQQPDKVVSLLAGEILLAVVLIALVMALIAPSTRPLKILPLLTLVAVLGAIATMFAEIIFDPNLPWWFWLAVLILPVILVVIYVRRGRRGMTMTTVVLAVGWAAWLTTLFTVPPALSTDYLSGIPILGMLAAAIFGVPVAIRRLLGAFRLNSQAAWLAVGLSVLTALLFLVPFVVWTQNGIPYYTTAAIYAVLLVAAMCFASRRYLRRYAPMPTDLTA